MYLNDGQKSTEIFVYSVCVQADCSHHFHPRLLARNAAHRAPITRHISLHRLDATLVPNLPRDEWFCSYEAEMLPSGRGSSGSPALDTRHLDNLHTIIVSIVVQLAVNHSLSILITVVTICQTLWRGDQTKAHA
jgi:hypothetical protein